MTITFPGVFDMPSDEYHADPCDTPSLSAGMITDLLAAPAKCFEASRRLNPNWEPPETEEKFTLGTVRHVLFLEPDLFDAKVTVVRFDDWRTKEAKSLRSAIREAGKTPILEKHMDRVHAARRAFLATAFLTAAFADGFYERSMFWRHPEHGFWCRSRPDFIAHSGAYLNDYKATKDANPENFGAHAFRMGYHRRAAWYLDGAAITLGREPDHYWFVNQEDKAPYLTSVIELDVNAIEAGRAQNARASAMFARCLETGEWHGYRDRASLDRDRAFRVGLPNYAFYQMEARED